MCGEKEGSLWQHLIEVETRILMVIVLLRCSVPIYEEKIKRFLMSKCELRSCDLFPHFLCIGSDYVEVVNEHEENQISRFSYIDSHRALTPQDVLKAFNNALEQNMTFLQILLDENMSFATCCRSVEMLLCELLNNSGDHHEAPS